jgi:proteasome lid subunit RPN8/RPN11
MSSTTPAVMIDDLPYDVRESIYDHVFSSDDIEVGGVLVGSVGDDGIAQVQGMIPALEAQGSRASVTFTHDAWEEIIGVQERDFPDSPTIVGWYHSHPGFGVFLSEHDMFIHENFFTEPFHVAFVVDPQDETEGMFGWQDGRIVRLEDGRTPRRRGRRRPTIVVDVADEADDLVSDSPSDPVARADNDEERRTIVMGDDEAEPGRQRRRGKAPLLAAGLLVAGAGAVVALAGGFGSGEPPVAAPPPRQADAKKLDGASTARLIRGELAHAKATRARDGTAQLRHDAKNNNPSGGKLPGSTAPPSGPGKQQGGGQQTQPNSGGGNAPHPTPATPGGGF